MAILRYIFLAGLLCLSIFACDAYAQERYTDSQVKAAFLYNFLSFVGWPEHLANIQNISVCMLGEDPVNNHLNAFHGDKTGTKTVAVKKIRTLKEAEKCHAVFIGKSEEEETGEIINHLKNHPVLTVSSIEGFAESGGIIGFITENNKVRFKINIKSARQAGLAISSKLLRVAYIVEGK